MLLRRPDDAEARRALLGALVDAIDRGIARVVRNPAKDNDRTELFNAFIYNEFLKRTFLQGIVGADSAEAYATQTARNFAVSKLRGPQGIRARVEQIDTQAAAGIVVDDRTDPDDEEIDDESATIRDSKAAKRFDALPDDDKLLFYLVHDVPPRWAIEHLAKKRGVAVAQIEAELARRVATHDGELDKLRDELERRGQDIQRLHYRIASVRGERLAKEGTDPVDLPPASSVLVQRMQSRRARESASRADLLAYELHLAERVDTLQGLQVEARRRLHDPEARSKRWDELLALLGELPANAAERKRAVNRITVHYKRLCARIRGGEE
ncbi:MAG TPA: hypothetical protein VH165_05110 [Kofleriaceae bacterium]|nr:hypothetical protein [Kofleriaceae bacterium]